MVLYLAGLPRPIGLSVAMGMGLCGMGLCGMGLCGTSSSFCKSCMSFCLAWCRFQQMVREKEEERKRAQKEEEKRSVQMAVGKLKKQASVDKGTFALGRGAWWEGRGGVGRRGEV